MKRIYNVINLLPVKEILNMEDDMDLTFGEGVYIQLFGDLSCADGIYVQVLKQAILTSLNGKKDFNRKIYKLPGFEFNGI